MELKIEEIKTLEPIKFNYEELKKWLEEKVKNYKNLVYTDENIGTAKSDRADLNKLKRALNDEKIRVKKMWLTPYDTFETKIKELIGIVDVAVDNVDTQVKDYEQKFKDEKKKEIEKYFHENVGDYKELISLEKIFNDKWLNKTYKIDDIKKEIKILIARTDTHMKILDGQVQDENMNTQIKSFYFDNIGSQDVLTLTNLEINKIKEQQKKLENLKQKEIPKVTESSLNNEKNSQNASENQNNLTQIDFRVWVTGEQMKSLKLFLVENHIKYGRVK